MAIHRREVKGRTRWVIDRDLFRADGSKYRYRRNAKNQLNKAAAAAEEQQICEYWAAHGRLPSDASKAKGTPPKNLKKGDPTWDDAVLYYREHALPALKETTRHGYDSILRGPWFEAFTGVRLTEISYKSIKSWGSKLAEARLSGSTQRNHHIVVRSVLRSVGPVEDEPGVLIQTLPKFPKLPSVGTAPVISTDPHDVDRLIAEVTHPGLRIAIALAAFAGLRAGEVRELVKGDIDLKTRKITIARSRGFEEVSTPKGKHARHVPIIEQLLPLLEDRLKNLSDTDHVSTDIHGEVWDATVFGRAYRRAARKLGVKTTRFHSLRHHFTTRAFAKCNADAITVMKLLGHQNLSTTQRYAHTDYERAVEVLRSF